MGFIGYRELIRNSNKCQGTTLVVPYMRQDDSGL